MARRSRRGGDGTVAGLSPVDRAKTLVRIGEKAQESWSRLWASSERMYRGLVPGETKVTDKQVTVNLGYAYVRSLIPALYFRDPYISVNPKRPPEVVNARIAEIVINYLWSVLDWKLVVKRCLWDAVVRGWGVFKYGYAPELSGSAAGVVATEDGVFGQRVHPRDLLWDPQAATLAEAEWVIHRVWRTVDDVKSDPTLTNTARLTGVATLPREARPEGLMEVQVESVSNRVELFEVWDQRARRLQVVTPESDQMLRDGDWDTELGMTLKRAPFEVLAFNWTPDEVAAVPDLNYVRDQMMELTSLRTSQASHLKKFVRQYLAQKGAIKAEDQEKMEQALDGAIIEVASIAGIKPLEYAAVGPDFGKFQEDIKTDIRETLGQSELARGGIIQERRTLGEVQLIARGSQTRIEERVDVVEDFCERIAREVLRIVQQKFDRARVIRVTGDQAATWPPSSLEATRRLQMGVSDQGFSFTRQDVVGDFDVEVRAGSTLPLNREGEIRRMTVLRELAKEHPELVNIKAILAELLRLLDVKNVEQILTPAPGQAAGQTLARMAGRAGGLPAVGAAAGGLGASGGSESGTLARDLAAALMGGQAATPASAGELGGG